jgi:type I restriction enzyme S subunit
VAKQSPSYHFAPGDTVSAVGKHSQPYPWEQRKFSELYSKNVERNSTNEFNFDKTISIAKMRYNSEGNGANKNSLQNYKVIRIGDVAFEGHTNKEFQYGRFVVNSLGNGIMSPRFAVLRPIRPTVVNFWKYYLHNERSMNRILVRATKAGTMMNELVYSDLAKEKIKVPIEKEQIEIGNLFSILDRTITLHEEQHRQLEQLKKALLQKMFADETGYPALRFKGFTEKWEQRKLGETVVNIVAGGDINKAELLSKGKYPVYANALTNNGIVGYYASQYRIAAPAVTVTGRGDIGIAKARDINFTPVVRLLAISSQHNNYFLENLINTHRSFAESTGVPQLTVPQLSNYKLYFPQKINEEVFIGKLFKKMDHLTTLHQHKIDNLKRLKRALLQKMFV